MYSGRYIIKLVEAIFHDLTEVWESKEGFKRIVIQDTPFKNKTHLSNCSKGLIIYNPVVGGGRIQNDVTKILSPSET